MLLLFLIRFLFLALGVCLVVGLGAGAAMTRAAQPPPRVTPAVAPSEEGRAFATKFFRRSCARCHSEDFTGADARDLTPEIPDFTSAAWQTSRSDAQLLVSILEGKGRRMPAYHGRLDRGKARALVAYVRQAGPPRPEPASPPDDFERRFAELQQQLEELREQYRRLLEAAQKQRAKDADKPGPRP
jgi:mono/diheme cytochrome c family protein